MLGRAVLINNPDSVQFVHDHFLSSFEVGLGKNGQGNSVFFHVGQTPDYSWHQHNFDGSQHYWLGYGMRWIEEAIYYSEFTDGTSWALGSAQFQQLEDCYLEGIQYLFYRGQGLYSAAGRDGLRKAHWSLETYVYKRLIDDLKAAGGSDLRRLPELNQARAYLNNVSDPSFSVNRYYQNSDLLIKGRPNHYFALKMISNRTVGPESGNGNGKKVFHFGGGSTMIHQQGGEYTKARVGWNYRALPGITAEQKTSSLPLVDWGWDNGGLNAFAGGLDNDTLACAGFQLHRDNSYATVRGNKGYFFFDREMVCLGSNIHQAGPTGKEIWTSLNQPEWRTPVTYRIGGSKQELSMNSDNQLNFSLNQTGWIHQDGIGYVVLPGSAPTDLKLWAETRSGNWRDLDSRNSSQTEQVEIFQLSINHGTNPSADAYQYIVVPEIQANEMDGYLAQLPIRILRNSSAVQAVKHLPSRTTQAIFYDATEQVQTDNGLLIETDRPVILMIQEEANGLRIRWSDPLQSQSQVVISLNQAFQSSIFLDFPDGLEVGTSQEAFFAYEENGGGTFPLVWGEIQAEAQPELGKVQLLWSTESEENNAQFQIERSRDGLLFSAQDQITSQGNSTTVQSYVWDDPLPASGKSFYRLRQIDLDGQYSYSPLAEVLYKPSTSIRIEAYPVPVRRGEKLRLVLYASQNSVPYVQLVDMMGREVRRYPISGEGEKVELRLETDGLTTGIYFLTAGSAGEVATRQIVIQE
jgi:hypothetical protein